MLSTIQWWRGGRRELENKAVNGADMKA